MTARAAATCACPTTSRTTCMPIDVYDGRRHPHTACTPTHSVNRQQRLHVGGSAAGMTNTAMVTNATMCVMDWWILACTCTYLMPSMYADVCRITHAPMPQCVGAPCTAVGGGCTAGPACLNATLTCAANVLPDATPLCVRCGDDVAVLTLLLCRWMERIWWRVGVVRAARSLGSFATLRVGHAVWCAQRYQK